MRRKPVKPSRSHCLTSTRGRRMEGPRVNRMKNQMMMAKLLGEIEEAD
jgi:hypothetical protein